MRGSSTLLVLLSVPLAAAADPPEGWKEVKGGFRNQAYAVWLPADGKIDSSQDSLVARGYGQVRIFRTVCERQVRIFRTVDRLPYLEAGERQPEPR